MTEKQKTIKSPVTISGIGLHTGKKVILTYKPAPENHGYKFQRIDLQDKPIINADIDNVIDTLRGTNLKQNGTYVNTVEHVLAAVAGLGIDNILIELNGPETPIMDGSSSAFIEALSKAGILEQNAGKKYFDLKTIVHYLNNESQTEILAVPCPEFRLTVMVDYSSPILGCQHASLENINDFKDKISSSRTFVFLHELENLAKQNLIKGGDLDNAIVVTDKVVDDATVERLAILLNKPKVKVRKQGILNNVVLKHQNEPARHKLLDIIGDMALIGMPINAQIIASKPGHTANIEFAKKIKKLIKQERLSNKPPVYRPDTLPLFDINQIKKILPHRHPFLFIDKILEMSDTHVIGLKNVTMDEPFFKGHFPGNPIMPGVLQIEAMAQAGGVLALSSVPDPENYITYFLKAEKVKFKNKVVPGDTIIFKLELISPIRRGICHMKGLAYVGNKVVMEGELMAQIVKKDNDN
ncbi:MAG: bifunctional UDP-3-O-[3-hydroxymyristoyl] N-acetylglucosamine deacetylase/3-hydroxyacyl-ACP dehydratase [Bacteroidota bacterium]